MVPQGGVAPAAPVPSAPVGDPNAPFAMDIEDVFNIKGKGTIVTGKIAVGRSRWAIA